MEFKYINSITDEVAEIRLYKRIGSTYDEAGNYIPGVNGADFANEMEYLQTRTNLINVRINSGGGTILDAMAIQASIMNSKVPVNCYIDGLAASAAGSIALSGKKCMMADYAMFMVHEAQGGDDKVRSVFNESVATFLSNRMGKEKPEVLEMMKKETWLNAKEAAKMGIVDEVISTKKKAKSPKITNVFEMEKIYNQLLIEKPKMENINNELGIDKAAAENVAVDAIKNLKEKVSSLTNEVDSLKKENGDLKKAENDRQEAEKAALKTEVENFANELVKDKKIKEDEKSGVIENCLVSRKNFDFIKSTYAKISNVKEAKKIFNPETVKNKAAEDRTSWTYINWVEKDPIGLEKMMNEDPEAFKALQEEAASK